MTYFWLIVFAILLIAEIVTAGTLVSIWFSFGALAAFLVQKLGFGMIGQLVAFIIVSVALLFLTKPFVKKVKPEYVPTNMDRLLGKVCIVMEDIDELGTKGSVAIDGKEWSAMDAGGKIIPAGERVRVKDIKGVKLIVEKLEGDE
ncbi:MAG: NfeD family protein [Lachnospiraceae bacterium]|nr:NfeD family protein [Lachnospiraceae bacterium]